MSAILHLANSGLLGDPSIGLGMGAKAMFIHFISTLTPEDGVANDRILNQS